MKKIAVEIDCDEKECGGCYHMTNGNWCWLFDVPIKDKKRCQTCLDAELKTPAE